MVIREQMPQFQDSKEQDDQPVPQPKPSETNSNVIPIMKELSTGRLTLFKFEIG